MFYKGTATPGLGITLPAANFLFLRLNGVNVASSETTSIFTDAMDDEVQSLSGIVNVSSVPSTLSIVSSGDTFNYSVTSLTIFRLGDIPSLLSRKSRPYILLFLPINIYIIFRGIKLLRKKSPAIRNRIHLKQ